MRGKVTTYAPGTLVSDMPISRKYNSLLARLHCIYRSDLSVASLLNISDEKFAAQRGIGELYVTRFKELKNCLSELICAQPNSELRIDAPDGIVSNVSAEYIALFHRIQKSFPHVRTYADICAISPSQFAAFSGVGKKKVSSLIRWQGQIMTGNLEAIVNAEVLKQLEGYRFSSFFLSEKEQKLLVRYVRRGMSYDELTPLFVINQNALDIRKLDGFGKKASEALKFLQFKILEGVRLKSSEGILIPLRFGESLSLTDLSRHIAKDISRFYSNLGEEKSFIWKHRMGYQDDLLTLQEIGDKIGVTRERIRQRAEGLNDLFLRGVRVSPSVLQQKLSNIKRTELLVALGDLRSEFNSDASLLKMLAMIADIDPKELMEQVQPSVRNDVLDEFFYTHPYPAPKDKVVNALQDELGVIEDEAEIYLGVLEKNSLVRCENQHVIPRRLRKEIAVAHLLAGFKDGLGWKEVAFKVNESGICRVTLSLERPDQVLNASANIFLSSARRYSHTRYLQADKDGALEILNDIKSALKESSHQSLHLMSEYYSMLVDPNFDYYTVRYIARDYGESFGVYFNGKSQSDTVSLNPNMERVSQKEAVKRLLQNSEKALSIAQVARHIKSQTEGHAQFYISELIHSGEVVSPECNSYISRDRAFADVDCLEITKIIVRLINEDTRIHHISSVAQHVNRITKSDYSIRFYRTFAFAYLTEQEWFVRGMLISINEIAISGLAALVRQVPADFNQEDMIARIQQRVCASRDVVKRAIYNVRNESKSVLELGAEQGLASDILEELFSL